MPCIRPRGGALPWGRSPLLRWTTRSRTTGGAEDSRIPRAKQESARDRSAHSDVVVAVAQSPGEPAGSVLRPGSENGQVVRHAPPAARHAGELGISGTHFRERAAPFPRRLYATATVRSECLVAADRDARSSTTAAGMAADKARPLGCFLPPQAQASRASCSLRQAATRHVLTSQIRAAKWACQSGVACACPGSPVRLDPPD